MLSRPERFRRQHKNLSCRARALPHNNTDDSRSRGGTCRRKSRAFILYIYLSTRRLTSTETRYAPSISPPKTRVALGTTSSHTSRFTTVYHYTDTEAMHETLPVVLNDSSERQRSRLSPCFRDIDTDDFAKPETPPDKGCCTHRSRSPTPPKTLYRTQGQEGFMTRGYSAQHATREMQYIAVQRSVAQQRSTR